ncbi:MAG: ABC transporter ATP-binding protein [Polyangiales bacterium]
MTQLGHGNLWAITRGQRRRYLGVALLTSAANGLMFGTPLVARHAIDVVVERDVGKAATWLTEPARWLGLTLTSSITRYLVWSGLAIVLLTAIGGYFQYLRGLSAGIASESIARDLRNELYRRLHHLRAQFYDTADTGDLVQRCSSDVDTLRVFLSGDVVEIARVVLLLVIVTPILFAMDTGLAWASLVLMPAIIIFAYVFFKQVKKVFEATDEAEAAMTAVLQESLTGIRVVRAFARQDFEISKFAAKNAQFRDHNFRLMRLLGLFWSTSDCLCLLQIGIVLMTGAIWATQGRITVGTLFAFMTCEALVVFPIRQIGRVLTESGKAVVALGRVNEILSSPEETLEPIPARTRADGELRLEHVTFGYDPARPVIRDLSLHVRAGETLAIVGAPGSGKTTLIRLLLRLYAHGEGAIRIDGQDITTASRQWLRRQIGVVLQDPFLYSRTVQDNLLVGQPGASRDVIEQATRDAALHDAIERFTDGYQTLVGERGVTLSGGQRQRLALARALIKDPPILVLDDSLSAVDTRTEAHILGALRARRGRHTTLVIAHRLSSVANADRILVLEHGRAVQLGDHATLSQIDGPYRRLVQIQGDLDAEISADLRLAPTVDSLGA